VILGAFNLDVLGGKLAGGDVAKHGGALRFQL
jgi:hypothetical protein